MDRTEPVVIGLFALACLLAIHQSRTEDWGLGRKLGTLVFFVGTTVGLFLDDFLASDSSLLPWVEPIGAAIMLVGAYISWTRRLEDATRSA